MYIALGGLAFLLALHPGRLHRRVLPGRGELLSVGPIPVAFVLIVVLAVAMELVLRGGRWGWRLRAVGSDEEAARRIGIGVNRTVIGAYVGTALFVFLGALMLMGQYGIGDPSQGSAYTLTSVTAVVLGGTSLLGGRGTFIGPLSARCCCSRCSTPRIFLGLGSPRSTTSRAC